MINNVKSPQLELHDGQDRIGAPPLVVCGDRALLTRRSVALVAFVLVGLVGFLRLGGIASTDHLGPHTAGLSLPSAVQASPSSPEPIGQQGAEETTVSSAFFPSTVDERSAGAVRPTAASSRLRFRWWFDRVADNGGNADGEEEPVHWSGSAPDVATEDGGGGGGGERAPLLWARPETPPLGMTRLPHAIVASLGMCEESLWQRHPKLSSVLPKDGIAPTFVRRVSDDVAQDVPSASDDADAQQPMDGTPAVAVKAVLPQCSNVSGASHVSGDIGFRADGGDSPSCWWGFLSHGGCHTALRGACVHRSAVVVRRATARWHQQQPRAASFHVCNEGNPAPAATPYLSLEAEEWRNDKRRSGGRSRGASAEEHPATGLHVLTCWDYYGYHLWLCLLSLLHRLERTEMAIAAAATAGNAVENLEVLRQALLYNYSLLVVPTVVSDLSAKKAVGGATHFLRNALWRAVVPTAAGEGRVAAIPQNGAAPLCASAATVGGMDPRGVPTQTWRRLRARLIDELLPPDGNARTIGRLRCPPPGLLASASRGPPVTTLFDDFNVTVVQRGRNYRILNIDQVTETLRAALEEPFSLLRNDAAAGGGEEGGRKNPPPSTTVVMARLAAKVTVRVVVMERHTVIEQLRVAAATQLLVGVHGNGLIWAGAMRPGAGAVLELWPTEAFNGNYWTVARAMGLAYASVEHGRSHGKKMRYDFHANPALVHRAVRGLVQAFGTHHPLATGVGAAPAAAAAAALWCYAPLFSRRHQEDSHWGGVPRAATDIRTAVPSVPPLPSLSAEQQRAAFGRERRLFFEWASEAASHKKLWAGLGVRPKHLAEALALMDDGNGRGTGGWAALLANSVAALGLLRPAGAAAAAAADGTALPPLAVDDETATPTRQARFQVNSSMAMLFGAARSPEAFVARFAEACAQCAKIYHPATKARCLIACFAVQRLAGCAGWDVESIALLGVLVQRAQAGAVQRDAQRRRRWARIAAAQRAFFGATPVAKDSWNKNNPQDPL